MGLNILQANCQGCYSVMCDIGVCMRENDIRVALLQEPYAREGRVVGVPDDMRVYMTTDDCGAAVLIDDRSMDAVQISVEGHNLEVCVNIDCELGSMCVVSVYCRYGDEIRPYLE
ncbi:hypothetical protein Zmor_027967 [Zophobas morio]|uniref:Uncharacterized protein n=1 Tax=Zophobas morio TaxID=2755281 RepID=A0AA38HP04_9CUCU|nr:hypothetical protein Zmor_027967 [Zophobas morio]